MLVLQLGTLAIASCVLLQVAAALSLTLVALAATSPPPHHEYLRPPPPPEEDSVVQRVARWFFPSSSTFFGTRGPSEVFGGPPPPAASAQRRPKHPSPPFRGPLPPPPRYGAPLKVAESKPPPQLRPWRRPPPSIHYGSPKPHGGHPYIPRGPLKQQQQHGPSPPPKKKDCNPCNKIPWIPVAAPGGAYGPPEADHGAYSAQGGGVDQKPAPDEAYGPPPLPPLIEVADHKPWPTSLPRPEPTHHLVAPPPPQSVQNPPPLNLESLQPPPDQHVQETAEDDGGLDVVKSVQLADFVSSVEYPVEVIQAPPYLDVAPVLNVSDQKPSGSSALDVHGADRRPQFSTTFNLHDNFTFPRDDDDLTRRPEPQTTTTPDVFLGHGTNQGQQLQGSTFDVDVTRDQRLEAQTHNSLGFASQNQGLYLDIPHGQGPQTFHDPRLQTQGHESPHHHQQQQLAPDPGFGYGQEQTLIGLPPSQDQGHDHTSLQHLNLGHSQGQGHALYQPNGGHVQGQAQVSFQDSQQQQQEESNFVQAQSHDQHNLQDQSLHQQEHNLQDQSLQQHEHNLQQQSFGQDHNLQQQSFDQTLAQDQQGFQDSTFQENGHAQFSLDQQRFSSGSGSVSEGQRVIVDIQPSVQTAANGGSLIYQINNLGSQRPTAPFPPTQTSVLVSFQHGPPPSAALPPPPPPRSPIAALQNLFKPDVAPSQFLSPPGFNAPPLWIPPPVAAPAPSSTLPPPPPDSNAVASFALPGLVPPPPPPKKTKQIQIIVPYTSSKELIHFDDGVWRPLASANCSDPRESWQARLSCGEDFHQSQESKTVTSKTPHVIRELLKGEQRQSERGVSLQKLQKNIDDWTAQQFSRTKVPSQVLGGATTLKHRLAPSKKIPEEYLTTTPLPDHEAAGSHAHAVTSWEFVEANLVLPEEVTVPPSTSTEDATATEDAATTTPPWEALQVSISPITKEKVYVVTPLASWDAEEPSSTDSYRLPKAEAAPRFLVRPTPASSSVHKLFSAEESPPKATLLDHFLSLVGERS